MEREQALGGSAGGSVRSPARISAEECEKNPPTTSADLTSSGKLSGPAKAGAPRKMVSSSGSDDSTPPYSDTQRGGGNFQADGAKSEKAHSSSQESSQSSENDEMNNDDSSGKSGKAKKKKPKLDRSKLRKGKWTVSLLLS